MMGPLVELQTHLRSALETRDRAGFAGAPRVLYREKGTAWALGFEARLVLVPIEEPER